MRLLATFVGQHGHFEPIVPIVRAARRAGHEVTIVCRPSMVESVAAAGFEVVAGGPDVRARTDVGGLQAPDRAREEAIMRDGFASWQAGGRVPDLVAIATERSTDLVLWDETDFGAAVACAVLDVPSVRILVLASGALSRPEVVGDPLHRLREEHDLPPDPDLEMLHGDLALVPFPPAFRDPCHPLPPTARQIRPAALEPPEGEPPAWLHDLGAHPVVWFTLGTVFNMESGDLFDRLAPAFDGLPVAVVLTTGHQRDPVELGPLPPNVRAERFVPQGWLLPRTDLVISHGGSGSVVGALAHGAASIVLPMGADQPDNADRLEALGLGRRLDPLTVTPDDVAAAVADVLADDGCRARCAAIADDLAAQPGADDVVAMLERLV